MLNELIHGQTRLRIMTVLTELGPGSDISFTRLQTLLDMTPGNLSAHLKRLEQAGYLTIERSFTARGVPNSQIGITQDGVEAFAEYVRDLKQMMGATLTATHQT